MKSKLAHAVFAAFAAALLTAPAAAHHNANAQWHTEQTVELVGVLKQIRDIQPHAQWTIEVKNESGVLESWHLEAIQNVALRRQGVKIKEDLVPGKIYTFYVSPSRNGTKTAFIKGIMINGKRIDIVRL